MSYRFLNNAGIASYGSMKKTINTFESIMKVDFYVLIMLYIDGEVICVDGGFKNI